MKTRRVFLISGLSGAGKTTFSRALAQQVDGHRIVFSRKVANAPSGKSGSLPRVIRSVATQGYSKAQINAVKASLSEFTASGKTTLVLDGALNSKIADQMKALDSNLDIQRVFIITPKGKRITLVSLRTKEKGGGSRFRAKLWVALMDSLHKKVFGVDMEKMLKQSNLVIENTGTLEELQMKAVHVAKQK